MWVVPLIIIHHSNHSSHEHHSYCFTVCLHAAWSNSQRLIVGRRQGVPTCLNQMHHPLPKSDAPEPRHPASCSQPYSLILEEIQCFILPGLLAHSHNLNLFLILILHFDFAACLRYSLEMQAAREKCSLKLLSPQVCPVLETAEYKLCCFDYLEAENTALPRLGC